MYYKRLFILLLLILTNLFYLSYAAEIKGVVNVPARIEVYKDNNMIKREITDMEGLFKIDNLTKGKYKLIFSRGLEYEKVTKIVNIKKVGEVHRLNVTLNRIFNMNEIGWFSGDAHLHTLFSDGAQPFKKLVNAAHTEGLNFIISTEHNEGYKKAKKHLARHNYNTKDFIVILGEEVTTDFFGKNIGHFNAIGIKEFVRYNLDTAKEIFDEAHKHGGLIFICHPFEIKEGVGRTAGRSAYFWLVTHGYIEFADNFDGIEVWNEPLFSYDDEQTLQYWFKLLNQGYKYFAIANSDSHDIYIEPVGTPRTYVNLGKKELNEKNILAALKSSHAFLTDGPLIYKFEINNKSIGEEVIIEKDKELKVTIDIKSLYELEEISIIKNGFTFYREEKLKGNEYNKEFNIRIAKDGWFILMVKTKDNKRAITNPIWVKIKR